MFLIPHLLILVADVQLYSRGIMCSIFLGPSETREIVRKHVASLSFVDSFRPSIFAGMDRTSRQTAFGSRGKDIIDHAA